MYKSYEDFLAAMEKDIKTECAFKALTNQGFDQESFKLGYSMSAVRGLCEEVRHLNRLIEILERLNKEQAL